MKDLDLNGLVVIGCLVFGLWLLGGDRVAGAGLVAVAMLLGYAKSQANRKGGR